ncbi:hypothetical protein [Aeromonas veronii]|uniref:hypothetical protein n=1 Tax=Aeromonas veronii TaxID=654 RepID=UPI003D228958
MDDLVKKLRDSFSKASVLVAYSMPLKVTIGFLLTALGSSSVLGLLSEFAAYKYAIISGFRVPVEGIPYLRATVSLISLALIAVALLAYGITYPFFKSTVKLMSFLLSLIPKIGKLIASPQKTQNDKTTKDDEVTKDEVTKDEVTKDEVTKDEVTKDKNNALDDLLKSLSYLQSTVYSAIMSVAVMFFINVTPNFDMSFLTLPSNGLTDIGGMLSNEMIAKLDMKIQATLFFVIFLCYVSIFKPKLIKWIALWKVRISHQVQKYAFVSI